MTERTMPETPELATAPPESAAERVSRLQARVAEHGPADAAHLLEREPDAVIVQVLAGLVPATAIEILWELPDDRRRRILETAPPERGSQWVRNQAYPEDTVGRLMEHPLAIFSPDLTVRQTVERLRELVKKAFITYGFVTDPSGRLLGVLVFRELLFAEPTQRLREIMLANPFSLPADMPLTDAMRQVLRRHYPVYPVCDRDGRLVGVLRGQTLFEQQTLVLSAQPGAMVGVEKEERLATPWWRSLKFRHPWLQLNLVTAFAAAGVVGFFQSTIDRLVILAVFLPVLAGQSGNTGCQALAVALRGMTLGDLKPGGGRLLLIKEALLGLLNGSLVGVTAGLGMLIAATLQSNAHAIILSVVVFLAMVGSCMVSGISGVVVPLTLKRLGADPATASSIFLTTATDVTSMGLFLALATWLVR
jgi:magnesium transporter